MRVMIALYGILAVFMLSNKPIAATDSVKVVVDQESDESSCVDGVCPLSAPKAHASVYESHRSKLVTRTRTERVRRSGGSSGTLESHGSSGSSRRERRSERRSSYGSAGSAARHSGSHGGG